MFTSNYQEVKFPNVLNMSNIKLMMNTKAPMQFLKKNLEIFLVISILFTLNVQTYQLATMYEPWTSLWVGRNR